MAGGADKGHGADVVLAGRAEDADVGFVGVGGAETGDDEGGLGGLADGVFGADEDVDGVVGAGFAEPGFEVVEEAGDALDGGAITELGLGEEVGHASDVELAADGGEAEVAGELDERVDGGADSLVGFDLAVGDDAGFEGVG